MRRPFWAYLLVFAALATFGGFTYLTRHPDAEVLRRAESWPHVGPAVSRFRAAYRLPERRGGAAPDGTETLAPGDGETAAGTVRDETVPPRRFAEHVYVLAGMELKRSAAAGSPTVYTFERVSRAGKIERRGDWFRVDYHGREGWVLLEGYDEDAEVPFGEAPEPTVPVVSRAPEDAWLAAGRRYLRGQERRAALGPYALYTDLADDALIAHLGAVARQLDAVYAERYGRRPLGEAAEAVVLYRSDIAYRLLQRQTDRLAGLESAGHNSKGVAVLFAGSRSRAEVTATLVHELTHFVNRRAVGPQLPPWLDEGLADDLAHSRIDAEGRFHPGQLGGERLERGGEIRLEGGHAALWRLRAAVRDGSLPHLPGLMRTDWEAFVRTPRVQIHYDAAAFWIRYLLEGENGRHAAAFRAFLDAVAGGGPATAEALGARLDADWTALDAGFRAWIETRAEAAGLPPGSS